MTISQRQKTDTTRKDIFMVTYESLKANKTISTYIESADATMAAMGFTDHGFAHVMKAAETAAMILTALGYDERTVELARIAGYLHDIGNLVNRVNHAETGAVIAFRILDKLEMDATEIATVVTAIGNHDEGTGVPVNAVSAALILADKTDVRRSRVRNRDIAAFDIHDRVNYSVEKSQLTLSEDKREITLRLTIDTAISSVMDYFEIFLTRMVMSRKAAEKLGLRFRLVINDQQAL